METMMTALPIAAYLLGSIPFGLIMGRLFGAGDIRQSGSGNIGATNVLRTAGRTAGAVALLLDIAKGALPVLLAKQLFGSDAILTAVTAMAAFLGHLFPVWLRFKGGKGVATGLGIFLAWTPFAALAAMAVWLGTAVLFRFSSLSSMSAFAALPVTIHFLHDVSHPSTSWPGVVPLTALFITLWIFWRHRPNIKRLMLGEEPRIGQKGKKA